MFDDWRPAAGQLALIEPEKASPGHDCLTGVVMPGERLLVDLGASPRLEQNPTEVLASFFCPDALYRVTGTATEVEGRDGVVVLDMRDVERVQRRTAPRVRATLPVALSSTTTPVRGETVDVAMGGCRVVTDVPLPLEESTLTIDLPDGDPLVARGVVLDVSLSSGRWEYRIAFSDMADTARERLSRLVALNG
jgi:c-di-GMP-binding flagellar brake protein YcgR